VTHRHSASPARVHGPEHAGRELRPGLRPADGAVQGDLVLAFGAGPQALDHHQAVVVPGDLEGPRLLTEDLDLAGPVGLDPDRGRGLAHVAQERAEYEQGRSPGVIVCHAALVPRTHAVMTRWGADREGSRGDRGTEYARSG